MQWTQHPDGLPQVADWDDENREYLAMKEEYIELYPYSKACETAASIRGSVADGEGDGTGGK